MASAYTTHSTTGRRRRIGTLRLLVAAALPAALAITAGEMRGALVARARGFSAFQASVTEWIDDGASASIASPRCYKRA